MRSFATFLLLSLAWVSPMPAPVLAGEAQTCSVFVDITDSDPRGTNVRAAPGSAVIAALKNTGDGWVSVHLTGQAGDWFRIDRASLVDAGRPQGGTTIFHGTGWLHKSVLGVSGMQNGGAIYADHDTASRAIDHHAAGDQAVSLLGCWGPFLKVQVKKGVGWTRDACTNMNTTCA
ncbi:MAG: hypothetical protein JWO50_900 [Candidatus Kaiserbacteria bacterium]|nr:hypothetical protein [Candidatus Kaiserbacteria bacterium]